MLTESQSRKVQRSLYLAAKLPIPARILQMTDEEMELRDAIWNRYEQEKNSLPLMEQKEYEDAVQLIAERLGL